jgi:hypothetical protein
MATKNKVIFGGRGPSRRKYRYFRWPMSVAENKPLFLAARVHPPKKAGSEKHFGPTSLVRHRHDHENNGVGGACVVKREGEVDPW